MKRFWQILSQNAVGIAIAVAGLIAINLAAARYPLHFDLTDEKEFSIAPSTHKIFDRLEDRLTIKTYFSKDLPPQLLQIRDDITDLLKEFQAFSHHDVIIENVDPDSNEVKEQDTKQIGIVPLQINVIEKDKREVKKAFMGIALYYRDQREVIPVVAQTDNLEYLIDTAVLKMTAKEMPRIGVLIPPTPNEDPESGAYHSVNQVLDQITSFQIVSFNEKNLTRLNLKSLLIIEPKNLPDTFIDQLDGLLKAGTNIIIFSGPVDVNNAMIATRQPMALNDWLSAKGVTVTDALLLDPVQSTQASFKTEIGQLYLPYPFWARTFQAQMNLQHPITSRLEEVVFPWSGALELTARNDWQSETLISSSSTSFLQPGDEPDVDPQYINKMSEMPEVGARPLSAVISHEGVIGKIFVTASHYLLQDSFMEQAPVNAVYLQNLAEFTTWGDQLIGVRSRGKTNRPLSDVSEDTKSYLKWIHVAGVPLVAVLSGLLYLAVMRRRRSRVIADILSDSESL